VNALRYDSPSVYGFILSASVGDNDYADVALRFNRAFGDFRVAGAVSYQWDSRVKSRTTQFTEVDEDDGTEYTFTIVDPSMKFEVLAGSVSVMHAPTGLYGAFAAGRRDWESSVNRATLQDPSYWYAQGGVERKFLPFGTTTIYGEYGLYKSFEVENRTYIPGQGLVRKDSNSEATRVGFGVVQKIDSAAMDIYAQASIWSFEDVASRSGAAEYGDLSTVLVGSRIKF
jgi:hypothetical protein